MTGESRIAELLERGFSRVEIGRRLGIDHRKVCAVAKRLGFPPKVRRKTKYDWAAIRAFYNEGHSRAETRARFAITEGAWGSAVERGDIVLRSRPSASRRHVAELLEQGLSQKEIASALGVSKATVAHHVRGLGVPADSRFSRRYDWDAIQEGIDRGLTVVELIDRYGFSRSSYTQAVRRGDLKPREWMIPLEDLLVVGRKTSRTHLKRRLLAADLKENRCEDCGITHWRGKPLSMQLHHRNGDGTDNRLENLQLLCPNDHSLTDTYGGRNGHRRKKAA